MRRRLRAFLPAPARLQSVRGLGWLAPLAARRELWRLDRRRVALGLALGVFFGLLIPFGQILFAAAAAFALRANVAAAALGTLASNPLTIAPLYALAYAAGAALLGLPLDLPRDSLAAASKPLVAGLAALAIAGAVAAYLAVEAAWRLAARRRAARWSSLRNPEGERP